MVKGPMTECAENPIFNIHSEGEEAKSQTKDFMILIDKANSNRQSKTVFAFFLLFKNK